MQLPDRVRRGNASGLLSRGRELFQHAESGPSQEVAAGLPVRQERGSVAIESTLIIVVTEVRAIRHISNVVIHISHRNGEGCYAALCSRGVKRSRTILVQG